MSDMKAIGFTSYGDAEVLKELSVPKPVPGDEDVLVRVKATATNPVDCKIRSNWGKGASEVPQEKSPFICGYDGAGVVEAVGKNVTKFKEGDEVYFAGVMSRQGSNADYTLLDERVVALKPKNVSFAEAAGFPLTGLTAIEGLVESLHVRLRENETKDDDDNGEKVLLVIGGAGGVGSMVIQLAKQWLRPLRVVATASRPETVEWCKKLGADDVINHKNNLKEELEKIGVKGVDYVFNTASTEQWFEQIVDIANPLARIVLINETDEKLPLGKVRTTVPLQPQSRCYYW